MLFYNRLVMLFTLMPSVDMLCSRAEVVGGRMPTRPNPIRPQLKPMMKRSVSYTHLTLPTKSKV